MAEEQAREGSFSLETVLAKILDFNAGRGGDFFDSMLLLSLVNLLGVISLLNKQAGASGEQASGALGPLAGMLLNVLAGLKPEERGGAPEAGQGLPGPAALINLLGAQQGKTPDLSALLKLLGGLTGGPGKLSAPVAGGVQPEARPEAAEAAGSGKVKEMKEIKKEQQGPLKWDARL